MGCGGGEPPLAPLVNGGRDAEVDEEEPLGPVVPFDVAGTITQASFYALEGGTVEIYDTDLTLLTTTTTDAVGSFTASAAKGRLNYVRVIPTAMDMGAVFPIVASGTAEPYLITSQIRLEERERFSTDITTLTNFENVPLDYDETSASVAVNFNAGGNVNVGGYGPVVEVGGEALTVAYVPDGDPATPLQLKGAVLPPKCPTKLDGLCRTTPGPGFYVYFPNVAPDGDLRISVTSAPGMSCSMRHNDGKLWPMFADSQTIAIVDCGG